MTRTIEYEGQRWSVAPSGFVTQYVGDEFGVIFTRAGVDGTEVRFSRYSPGTLRSRDAAFEALTDAALLRLFLTSQGSIRAPEGGYRS
jgi:hypothetical protein